MNKIKYAITEEGLIRAGYRKSLPVHKKHAAAMFQIRIKKDGTTLYFINIYQWNFRGLPTPYDESYSAGSRKPSMGR